jgi:hypothetical protein
VAGYAIDLFSPVTKVVLGTFTTEAILLGNTLVKMFSFCHYQYQQYIVVVMLVHSTINQEQSSCSGGCCAQQRILPAQQLIVTEMIHQQPDNNPKT